LRRRTLRWAWQGWLRCRLLIVDNGMSGLVMFAKQTNALGKAEGNIPYKVTAPPFVNFWLINNPKKRNCFLLHQKE
jgi:hypothetical protein